MPDRRLQPRLSDAELVMISFEDNGSRLQQLGNLENMSLNGVGIIVGHPIPAGNAVTITYGEGELTGIVRHCTPLAEGHFIGVEFAGSSKASGLHFQPELLIWPE
jgi:hypothetical protein